MDGSALLPPALQSASVSLNGLTRPETGASGAAGKINRFVRQIGSENIGRCASDCRTLWNCLLEELQMLFPSDGKDEGGGGGLLRPVFSTRFIDSGSPRGAREGNELWQPIRGMILPIFLAPAHHTPAVSSFMSSELPSHRSRRGSIIHYARPPPRSRHVDQ